MNREIKFRVWDGEMFMLPCQKGYEDTPWHTISFSGKLMYSDNMGISAWGQLHYPTIHRFERQEW